MSVALYVFLGAGASERAALLHALIQRGFDPESAPFTVYASERDLADEEESVTQLQRDGQTTVVPLTGGFADGPEALPEPPDRGTILFLADGRANPVDQLEALRGWMNTHGLELARIFTVIDCALLEANAGAAPWYDACIHFSDVVLLSNRADVSKKWVREYEKRLRREALPCHIAFVKTGGAVDFPAELLFPEPRRISQFFDPDESDPALEGIEIDGEPDDEDVDSTDPQSDPYLARTEQGYRVKRLVDITRFLPA
ncbi:MAG: hypothetical protein JJU00_10760 [Opitutales bacterium]|nr:hypothetical protein [Opitutales bacterium]